ncbi:MAG: glycosyltransferase, partial [Candidatus Kuenenbacteria bacterium]
SVITSNAFNTRYWYDPIFGKKIDKKFEIINHVKVYRLQCLQLKSFLALILVRYFRRVTPQSLMNKLQLFYCGPNLIGLEDVMAREKFDIVYSSPLPAHLNKVVALVAQHITPRPKLILGACFHDLFSDFHNPELEKFISLYDQIHVFTYEEKKNMIKAFRIPKDKFAVIPAFIKLQTEKRMSQIAKEITSFKKAYNLETKKIILFAGTKITPKGIYFLMEVMRKLSIQDASYILITIGNSNIPEWKKYINQNKPTNLIDLGYVTQNQKEIIFGVCDIYCMPSLCESFGLGYLEAWQMMKPVIGADMPITREIIGKAMGGLLVKFGNQKQLMIAILKLTKNSKMGQNGYAAIKTTYNFGKLYPKYKQLFSIA